MYNTQFQVKYNIIEEELLHKLQNKTPQETDEKSDEEHEYSTQDVIDICNKLYRDEFLTVFEAESLEDDKINNIMDDVCTKMMTNIEFKEIIDNISKFYIKEFLSNEDIDEQKDKHLRQSILMILFTLPLFYITHRCICQQLELGTIDKDLLVELRKRSIDLLQKNVH
jgi:hypothetical protein